MSALIAVAALGLGAFYLAPEYESSSNQKQLDRTDMAIRESHHVGFLRGANTAPNIASEETRIIRTPNYRSINAQENAAKSFRFYKEKNDLIANMTNGAASMDNSGIIRASLQSRPRLLQLPSREGWGAAFGDISGATNEVDSGFPAESLTTNWRDQYGDAGGFPRDGRSNVVINELFVGNAWGAGGQLFEAVGNKFRDPGYADNPPSGILKKPDRPANDRLKSRVKWQ